LAIGPSEAALIHLDTSALIDACTGPRRALPQLRRTVASGERINISTIVLYEWLRGPRIDDELELQEALIPSEGAVPFDRGAAMRASTFYRELGRRDTRQADFAIAACAVSHEAALWTLNPDDFRDISGLVLFTPPR
jgi:predicted nucleic acid-binding protein